MSRKSHIQIESNQNTRTANNSKAVGEDDKIGDEVQAKVVACAGDPGLSEPYFFDILSRFVIVMIEPCSKVPTNANYRKKFLLVRRPRHLWVDCPAAPDLTPTNSHASTRRKDYLGNINIGNVANYTINTIPQLDTDYTIGETLTIRKTVKEFAGQSPIFVSQFTNTDFKNFYAGAMAQNPSDSGKGILNGGTGPGTTGNSDSTTGGNPNKEVMEWTNDYWTTHGTAYNAESTRGPEWFKLKPLLGASGTYSGPVKPKRLADPNTETPGEAVLTQTGNLEPVRYKNHAGAVGGGEFLDGDDNNDRSTAEPGTSVFWLILHYYLIDSFMREQYPAFTSTIEQLQKGEHRYQTKAVGKGFYDKRRQKLVSSENLFPGPNENSKYIAVNGQKIAAALQQGVVEHSSTVKDEQTGAVHEVPKIDRSFIDKNVTFSFCEWEDVNSGNKQRSSRDECMPLVIASPNNFPTPKERAIGAIIYEPAYAKVAAAQNE